MSNALALLTEDADEETILRIGNELAHAELVAGSKPAWDWGDFWNKLDLEGTRNSLSATIWPDSGKPSVGFDDWPSYSTMTLRGAVAKRFPVDSRESKLSFKHHQVLSNAWGATDGSIPWDEFLPEARKLLTRAANSGQSAVELRSSADSRLEVLSARLTELEAKEWETVEQGGLIVVTDPASRLLLCDETKVVRVDKADEFLATAHIVDLPEDEVDMMAADLAAVYRRMASHGHSIAGLKGKIILAETPWQIANAKAVVSAREFTRPVQAMAAE